MARKRAKRGRKVRRKSSQEQQGEQHANVESTTEPTERTNTQARRARFVTTPDGQRVVLFRCGYCGKSQTRPAVEPDRPLTCTECTAPLHLSDVGDAPPPLPRVAAT